MHQTVNLNFYNVFCVPVKGTCKYGLIRSMDCLLKNKKLLTHDGRLVESNVVLKSKNLVLYYFSAAWCEKCSWESKKRKYGLEIIYVSADTDEASFSEDFKKHGNWYAVPFSNPLADELRYMYSVTNIPTVIVINKEGTIVSKNGRQEIEQNGINALIKWIPYSS